MLSDPVIKKSIYASIIASVLVIIFIQPFLSITGKIIIWLGNYIYGGISNSFYENAALGLREKYSFIFLMGTMAIVAGTIIGTSLIVYIKEKKPTKPKESRSTIKKYIITIILVILALDCIYLLSYEFAGFQMNASFNQRLTILMPVITDDEYKKIKAQWASMENRKEYESIVTNIERIAQREKIKLPKLLWK